MTDPAALITDPAGPGRSGAAARSTVAPRRGADGTVIAPMAPAAFINPAVIQRTAALDGAPSRSATARGLGACGGPAVTLPLRLRGRGHALGHAGRGGGRRARAAVGAAPRRRGAGQDPPLVRVRPVRRAARGVELAHVGRRAARPAARTVRVDVDADGHPGYLATARMLGEAGLLLAEPGATPDRAGCLTPATALGTESLDALRARAAAVLRHSLRGEQRAQLGKHRLGPLRRRPRRCSAGIRRRAHVPRARGGGPAPTRGGSGGSDSCRARRSACASASGSRRGACRPGDWSPAVSGRRVRFQQREDAGSSLLRHDGHVAVQDRPGASPRPGCFGRRASTASDLGRGRVVADASLVARAGEVLLGQVRQRGPQACEQDGSDGDSSPDRCVAWTGRAASGRL